MLRHSNLCWVRNFGFGKRAKNTLYPLNVVVSVDLQWFSNFNVSVFYPFVKHGSNGDRLFLHVFPFNTATLTGYCHAFQSARPLATGLPFRCLTTPCHTRGHVSFVLEGEAGLGRAPTCQSQKMICFFMFFSPGIVLTPCFRDGLWKAGAVSYLLYLHIQYIIESSYLPIDIGVSTKITKAVAFLPRSSIIISKGFFARYLWDTIACEVKRVFPKLNPHRNARCTGCTLYAA